jgi:N-acyl amino acid synthase of PEP-CTERM/exosortase system
MLNPFDADHPSVFVALADTPASKRLHHRLRYQVYCQKLAYEDPARFPDGEERDHYDEHAVQFVAYDRRRGDWAGTLRLVRPGPAGLPMTSVTGLASAIKQLAKLERVLEISRMCVNAPSPSAESGRQGDTADATLRTAPLVFFSLVRASVAYAFQAGISHLAFLTTPSLLRLLRRLGIQHMPAGDPCMHRGLRYPRVLDVVEEFRRLIERVDDHPLGSQVPIEPYQAFSSLASGLRHQKAQVSFG